MKRILVSFFILSVSLLLFIGCEESLMCEKSGGTVESRLCCKSVGNFPNLCLVGACTCGPQDSHEVLVCQCPEGFCWTGADGGGCIAINSATVEEDEIEYYLGTNKHTYELGSTVKATYRLTNKSNFVKLMGDWPNLGALQPIDIIQGAKVIWDVPMLPYEGTRFFLGPNKSCECTVEWAMETWPEREPVEPGIYTVIGTLKPKAVSVSVDIEIVSVTLAN
jgi:hypothetical protein